MKETLRCIYISFDRADVAIREKASLSTDEIPTFLQYLNDAGFAREFFVLSTCNRTEVYYVAARELTEIFQERLGSFKGNACMTDHKDKFISETDPEKVVCRLFSVSNGLLSQILGDQQIIGQVKTAYEMACKAETVGPVLHRLLQLVFSSHKDISTYTGIHAGSASVSYATAELIESFTKKELSRPVLVIGAGEFSREVIEQLKKKKYENITVLNRSLANAERLASTFNVNAIPFDSLSDLSGYDVIVSCISSSGMLVAHENFSSGAEGKLLIDLSVPRVMDPSLAAIQGFKLVNIDHITEGNKRALQKRLDAVPVALKIVDTYCEEFREWEQSILAKPALHHFKNVVEEIRKQEVSRHLKKYKVDVNEALIDQITKSIVNKIVRMPAVRLSEYAHGNLNELDRLGEALVKLFDLKSGNEQVAA